MNNNTPKASFSLESYKITHFSFNEPNEDNGILNIRFAPSGRYISEKSEFILFFDFHAFQENEQEIKIIEATLNSTFKFDENLEFNELPAFFYVNSLAIVFPHLRAFVTTLTTLANGRAIILPLLNLTHLEEVLRENTISE